MKSKLSCLLPLASVLILGSAHGVVLFVFDEFSPFDNAGIGGTGSLEDTAGVNPVLVTLTTLDVIGAGGTLASDPDGVDSDHVTNVFGNSIDALGIDSGDFGNGEYGNESRDFNPNEGWVFSFDVDVTIEGLDFRSLGGGSEMTLSSSEFTDLVFTGESDPALGGLYVPADTAITIQMTSDAAAGDTNVRLASFSVAAASGIPEAGTTALGLLSAVMFGLRRPRR